MTTATGEPEDSTLPKPDVPFEKLPRCKRCGLSYVLNKSTSALKLTYCSFLCELGDLGFSMAGLESMERAPAKPAEETQEPEPVAAQ